MNQRLNAGQEPACEDVTQLEKGRDTLRLLGELLETCGYDAAGVADSTQVARILSLSHEVTGLAERLRSADL
ncbi:MAG: hypothetical protein AAFY38_09070 [Pseudomonadota bacterium]